MKIYLISSLVLFSLFIVGLYAHGGSEPHIGEAGMSIFKAIKQYYQETLTTPYQQVTFSIFLVSFPSVPTFLLLVFIQKFFSKNYSFSPSLLNKLISFSVGTLLGDVMLHILPHLFEHAMKDAHSHGHDHHHDHDHSHEHSHEHDHDHGHDDHGHSHGNLAIPFMITAGVIIFFIFDFVFAKVNGGHSHDHGHDHGHGHSHEKSNKTQETQKGSEKQNKQKEEPKKDLAAFTYLIGDLLHNFTDGLAVGAAFSNNLTMGLTTTFVVVIHELPHEMGDFAYLIKKGFGLFDILKTQVITSLGALVGGIIGISAGEIYKYELTSITAGGLLYMCLSQILPDVRESLQQSGKVKDLVWDLIFMGFGIYSMYYITLIE